MCTPGDCTCPFPLMKRDLVTQDAQACSQCVEEFCPAVIEGDLTCSTAACDCEDPSWPRIDVGSADKPCMQCVHPHVDVTLRREGDGECLSFGENRTCTVFRYNGAAMIDKTSNRSSCLAWSNGEWQLMPCQGTPDSSAKFTQRGSRDEALTKGTFCTSRGKQCLHIREYMCTTDPSQCSTETCHCEDPSHIRKEMQTVDRSTCYLCTPSLPECPMSPAPCSAEPCECKPGFLKAQTSDELCFSCQPNAAQSVTGLTSFLTFLSAGATFLLCIALVAVVGCAIRGSLAGDAAPTKRKRRGSQARTWSENCALYLEEAIQVVSTRMGEWKPLKRVGWGLRKVVSFLDACDAALDPVYLFFEAGLDKMQNTVNAGINKAKKLIGQADSGNKTKSKKELREAREDGRQGYHDAAAKEPFVPRASQNDKFGAKEAGQSNQSISWDPINMNVSNEDWMNYVVPSASAQRQSARHARNDAPPPTSAVQRLRQRREAKAQAAAEKVSAQAATAEVEVDESWIDAMERKEAKEREAKEKAAAQRRERKQAAKARRAKVAAGGPQDADEDEVPTAEPEAKVEKPSTIDADNSSCDTKTEDSTEEHKAAVNEDLLPEPLDASQSQDPSFDPNKKEDGFEEGRRSRKSASRRLQQHLQQAPPGRVQPPPPVPAQPQQTAEDLKAKVQKRSEPGGPAGPKAKPSFAAGKEPGKTAGKEPPQSFSSHSEDDDIPKRTVSQPNMNNGHCKVKAKEEIKERLHRLEEDAKQATSFLGATAKPPGEESTDRIDKTERMEDQGKCTEAIKPEKREKRAWSEVVAPWAKRTEVKSNLGAHAPEFVPLAQQLQELGVHDSSELGITTVMVSGLSPDTTATGLFRLLDAWGLGGSFDFLHIMSESDGSAYANINFIDPVFVSLFCCLCQEYQFPGEISVSEVQGIKALTAQWVQSGDRIQAVVIRNAMPCQWAVNAVNTMLSPQLKGQFRKTKRCVNHKKNRCELGADCPFAHTEEELLPMPDLAKTKMCYNYFRRRCNDPKCKFAHGSGELRSMWTYPIWPMEVMQGFDFSQMQAYPADMCYSQESQGEAFSADRPAAENEGDEGDSILFEALSRKDEGVRPVLDCKVALRVRRTFMEVTQVVPDDEDDDDMPIGTSMRRSFSDSHLETLKEAMQEDSEL